MTTYAFRRKDKNQDAIVDTLRKLGIRVFVFGEECDLITQWNGLTMLCEVRPADKPNLPRPGRQAKFHDQFAVKWLQTDADCLELLEVFKRWHNAIRQSIT